jgi:nucleoside-diphosphate-sugar epimerase
MVTGAAGYIGSVLSRLLLDEGYEVNGVDRLMYGGEGILDLIDHQRFNFIKADVLRPEDYREVLEDTDAVVHLAAIVGEPACSRDEELAWENNFEGSKTVLNCAVENEVNKFVFASTCSNYGKNEAEQTLMNEESPLRPLSVYAESKVDFEKEISSPAVSDKLLPTVLRFATAHGWSPRMRFDLTVNDFTRTLVTGGSLEVYGKDTWRPYCHVSDIARAIKTVLESRDQTIKGEVFNVGSTEENYQKKEIVKHITNRVPEADVDIVDKDIDDPRNYRVDFSKIHDELGFELEYDIEDTIENIKYFIDSGLLSEPYQDRFKNV